MNNIPYRILEINRTEVEGMCANMFTLSQKFWHNHLCLYGSRTWKLSKLNTKHSMGNLVYYKMHHKIKKKNYKENSFCYSNDLIFRSHNSGGRSIYTVVKVIFPYQFYASYPDQEWSAWIYYIECSRIFINFVTL